MRFGLAITTLYFDCLNLNVTTAQAAHDECADNTITQVAEQLHHLCMGNHFANRVEYSYPEKRNIPHQITLEAANPFATGLYDRVQNFIEKHLAVDIN